MKRLRRLRPYAYKLIRNIKALDFKEIGQVRNVFDDITVFVNGLVFEIGKQNTISNVEDLFDYPLFTRRSRSYFSRLETHIYQQYNKIASNVQKTQRKVYFLYRRDIFKVLEDIDFTPIVTQEQAEVSFGGTPSKSFTNHLLRQMRLGHSPADLIKTVSQDHIRAIQRHMMVTISKGKGFGWGKDKLMAELFPTGVDAQVRRQMEQNITRIMRTSYMNAVNLDTTDFVKANQGIFYGSRRTADGHPCFACVVQDGRFYQPGEPLTDHPNGQCLLVPLTYPEEYFRTGRISLPINDGFGPTLAQNFYESTAAQQMRIMGNRKLFNLWKKEQFDLDKMVTGKFGTPITYQRAVAELETLGGISNPVVGFVDDGVKAALNSVIDPKDRLEKGYTILRDKPLGGNTQGMNLTGLGDDFIDSGLSSSAKSRVAALYGEAEELHWSIFNVRARELGIFTRKGLDGKFYYLVKDSRLAKQLRIKIKPVEIPKGPVRLSLDDAFKIDAEVDLVNLKGLDKIRWNAQGQARVIVDGDGVEGQVLKIYRVWDPKKKAYGYTFELKLTKKYGNSLDRFFETYMQRDVGKQVKGFKVHFNPKKGYRINVVKEGELVRYQKSVGKYRGQVWEVSKDGKFKLELYRNDKIQTYYNKVVMDTPAGLNLEQSLKILNDGLDSMNQKFVLKQATREDRLNYVKNRVKWSEKGVAFDESKVYAMMENERLVYYSDLAEDVMDNVEYLYHDMYKSTEVLESILKSDTLIASEERLMLGIGKMDTGLSVAADVTSGGANGVFLRANTVKGKYLSGEGKYRLVFDKKLSGRLDWYGFGEDMYGDVSKLSQFGGRSKFLSRGLGVDNELVFRSRVNLGHLKRIEVSTKAELISVKEALRKAGITSYNGISIDDFIILAE